MPDSLYIIHIHRTHYTRSRRDNSEWSGAWPRTSITNELREALMRLRRCVRLSRLSLCLSFCVYSPSLVKTRCSLSHHSLQNHVQSTQSLLIASHGNCKLQTASTCSKLATQAATNTDYTQNFGAIITYLFTYLYTSIPRGPKNCAIYSLQLLCLSQLIFINFSTYRPTL